MKNTIYIYIYIYIPLNQISNNEIKKHEFFFKKTTSDELGESLKLRLIPKICNLLNPKFGVSQETQSNVEV
jgi:hypothetical protein